MKISPLLYADDVMLLGLSEEQLQQSMREFDIFAREEI